MSEIEKTKRTDAQNEDWAIFPFNEAEDDARWAKLSDEMDELLEKTVSTEKLTSTILMKEDLSRFAFAESESRKTEEDQLF
jgi:hypothetical protein